LGFALAFVEEKLFWGFVGEKVLPECPLIPYLPMVGICADGVAVVPMTGWPKGRGNY
jgi:hypothetical protein